MPYVTLSLFYFFIVLQCPHLYICIVCMYIWLNCIYLYLNVYCQCLMLTVCTKGLRVTQFQFSVCMYCTCGRIDNKTYLTWLDLKHDFLIVFITSWECYKTWFWLSGTVHIEQHSGSQLAVVVDSFLLMSRLLVIIFGPVKPLWCCWALSDFHLIAWGLLSMLSHV